MRTSRGGFRHTKARPKRRALALPLILVLLASMVLGSLSRIRADGLYNANGVLGQSSLTAGTISGKTLWQPHGSAIDNIHHRLFLADTGNNRVLVFNLDANGALTNISAAFVLGQSSFDQNAACYPGPAGAASICAPTNVAVDSSGNRLFVVEGSNNRILEFDLSGGITNGMAAAHVIGQADFTSTGSGTAADQLSGPVAATVDSMHHRLFVADSGNARILEFDLSASNDPVDGTADHVLGQPDFTSGGSPQTTTSSNGIFSGVVYDDISGKLFASDNNSNRVLVFDTTSLADNEAASYVLGQPDFTSNMPAVSQSGMSSPTTVALAAASHQLFVTDAFQSGGYVRVLVFGLDANDTPTNGMPASHVLGQPDFTTANGSSDTQNAFADAEGSSVTSDGKTLYLSDETNNRALVYDLASGISDGMNATNTVGQTDINGNPLFTTKDTNNVRPNQADLNYPTGTALDTVNHRLFVADSGYNRIMIYGLDANNNAANPLATHVLGQADFEHGHSNSISASTFNCESFCQVAYDSVRQLLFVIDPGNNRVLVFDANPTTMTDGENAAYVLGAPDFTTAGSCAPTAQDFCPYGSITYDAATQRLFVQDSNQDYTDGRILIFDMSHLSNYPTAVHVLGQPDFTSSETGVDDHHFGVDVGGLAYNPVTDQLYAVDSDNNRVLVFDANPATMTNGEAAKHVLGQANFTSNAPSTTRSGFSFPDGLTLDSDHQILFVGDANPGRVMAFDVSAFTNGQDAMGVLGQPGFTSSGQTAGLNAATVGGLRSNTIMGDSYDPSTRSFYYPDSNDNRLMRFSFVQLTTTSLPNGNVGDAYSAVLTTANAQGTKTFSVSNGALPAGLSLNAATGQITGTPTTNGTYSFALMAADNNATAGTYMESHNYTVAITGGSPATAGTSPSSNNPAKSASPAENSASTPPDSAQAQVVAGATPILNTLPDYFNGGATVTFALHSAAHFCLAGNSCDGQELHTILLKNIDVSAQTAVFTFASQPQDITFTVGQRRAVDVNQDGKPDVEATLRSLTATTADLTLAPAQQVSASRVSAVAAKSGAKTAINHIAAWLIAGGAVVILVALAGITVYCRKRRARRQATF